MFRADLHPAMAANPLVTFTTVATDSGTLEFSWTGDNGYAASRQSAHDQRRLRFLVLSLLLAAGIAFAQDRRKSGYEFMSRETQAMQDDDVTGPAALSLLDGEALWKRKAGASNKACAECHQSGMKGVAARYPALYKGKLVNLEQRINACRAEQQKAAAFALETKDLLALTAYVGRQSRGMPISVVGRNKAASSAARQSSSAGRASST